MKTLPKALLITVVAIGLSGCGTPNEVRDLATETSANAITLANELQLNAKAAAALREARIKAVNGLAHDVSAGRLQLNARIAAGKAASDPAIKKYEDMRKFADEQQKAAAEAVQARNTAEAELRASIEAAKLPVEALTAVSSDLTTLAKKESLFTRAKANGEFVKEVVDQVKAARKEAEKKAEAAQ